MRTLSIGLLAFIVSCTQFMFGQGKEIIPLNGNTYLTKEGGKTQIGRQGTMRNWDSSDAIVSTYFKADPLTQYELSIQVAEQKNESVISVTVNGTKHRVKLAKSSVPASYSVGKIKSKGGYQRVDFQGISKKGVDFGTITAVVIDGLGKAFSPVFVREIPEKFTSGWNYWGRRGPSVHMGYQLPQGNVEYFYNEIVVPQGSDVIGSYFMTNGFGEGYCGIQVNSSTERRILFSVWSPFVTDDPKSIPDSMKIVLVKKGEGVHIGEFGNEGSGGQSYLKYNWKAGETIKIITQVHPNGDNSTTYTARFFDPQKQEWRLIASFKRPQINTWYRGAHSFLENFNPEQGYLQREVYFQNQWAYVNGEWVELTKGRFTCDATGASGVRVDFSGGITSNNQFYLKSFGFFNDQVKPYTEFNRKSDGQKPQIELSKLP